MQKKKLFFLFIFFAQTCFSEIPGKTFEECFQATLKRTTTIAIQEEFLIQAEARYNQAMRSSLPNISGLKSLGWPKAPEGKSSFTTNEASVESNTKLMLTQPLFQGFKEFAAQRQAKALVSANDYDKKHAVIQLYRDVALSFYTTMSLEVDISNANEELEHYVQRIKELKDFIRIGRSQTSDQLTTSSQAQVLRAQIKQLKGALRAQRAVISYLTGFDNDVPLVHQDQPDEINRPLSEYLANINNRPEVLANTSRQLAFDEGVKIAKGDYLPSLALQGDYFIERNGIYKSSWDIMLNLTVPIFSWGSVKASVDESISKKTQATLLVTESKRQAEQQIRIFYETYVGDREQYLGYVEATKISQKVFENDKRDYKKGLVTNLDVLQALITFQEGKRARDKAYFSMLADLEYIESAGGFRPIQQ